MASVVPDTLRDRFRVCARFANYAYVSGKEECDPEKLRKRPADPVPAELSNAWPTEYREDHRRREIFETHSWYKTPRTQHRYFKSHAYVCATEEVGKPSGPKVIVAGFRGTWLHPGEPARKPERTGSFSLLLWLSNFVWAIFSPANYGLADLYYDITLIRVPYRKGCVWKWYAYWGTLILEGSNLFSWVWRWRRRAAAGLISRPYGNQIQRSKNLLVHLGFWALWASAECFAGYDRYGRLWEDEDGEKTTPIDKNKTGVLHSVFKNMDPTRETEILVVGHSLGGAVSCFAALDIVAKLAEDKTKRKRVKVFHATFGAPPVGTKAFADHFKEQLKPHESWAIIHERDMVPECFAWCGSKWYLFPLRCFGWWSDWSRAGEEMVIRIPKLPPAQPKESLFWRVIRIPDRFLVGFLVGFFKFLRQAFTFDGWKVGLVLVGILLFLTFCILPVLFSPLVALGCWMSDCGYYRKEKLNPLSDWKTAGNTPGSDKFSGLDHVGVEYHNLAKYIKLLDEESPFGVTSNNNSSPSLVERGEASNRASGEPILDTRGEC